MSHHRIYADTAHVEALTPPASPESSQQVGALSERDEWPPGNDATPARTITLTLGEVGTIVGFSFVLGLVAALIAVIAGLALGAR